MAEEKNTSTDLSFLEEKKGPKLHVKDVLFIVLRNLHWLLLCGAVGALVAGYSVRHQNRVYESNAQLLIKGSTTGSSENSMPRHFTPSFSLTMCSSVEASPPI